MKKVFVYNFGENFIEKLADFLIDEFLKKNTPLENVACVFGGQRPGLFLKKALSKKIKKEFLPPSIFSIDKFIDSIVDDSRSTIADLDACFLIYSLAKNHIPGLLKQRESFKEFLPWAQEIVSFIEQLDLEDIKEATLKAIEQSAEIGYEIPSNINELLADIVKLRQLYHQELNKKSFTSRAGKYLLASQKVKNLELNKFDKVIFCNFFYLHLTEERIIKAFLDKDKAVCIFQGSGRDWSVLAKNAKNLGLVIDSEAQLRKKHNLSLYQGFDLHSQACLVREVFDKKIKSKSDSVIVLPRADSVVPLLSELSTSLSDCNVSLGYPLKRTAVYVFFDLLAKVQQSKKDNLYYSQDYLNVLKHPLVRNLKFSQFEDITAILLNTVEDILKGVYQSSVGGSLFIDLNKIEAEKQISSIALELLKNAGISIEREKIKKSLKDMHDLLFRNWEEVDSFKAFCQRLNILISVLMGESNILGSGLNINSINCLQVISDELSNLSFNQEKFKSDDIWEIFDQKLESEKVPFKGSPLKGTQILGLFETRSLNFSNVIIMDVNESHLPKLKIYEPLIPREVMLSLGLNRLEKEEEIQRYQFMRLISGANNVHLIYANDGINEKSRFIEELIWTQEKEVKALGVMPILKASFSLKASSKSLAIKKTKEVVKALKAMTYSASRINTYLHCPLQFYFRYVLGLEEREDMLMAPQSTTIGTFIHGLLEDSLRKFINKKPLIDKDFKEYFFKLMDKKFAEEIAQRMKSDAFLLKDIISLRLKRFLENEASRDVAKIISLEQRSPGSLNLNNRQIDFVYTVDRIDELADKSILVIDYKTGGSGYVPKRLTYLEDLDLSRKAIKENIKSFQLPLYYSFISKEFPQNQINAELYNIRNLEKKPFISKADYSKREDIVNICLKAMEAIFAELFNPDIDFEPDKDPRRCQHCSFVGLCR
tara:strand:- start:1009 stop:3825 length:2817 start_codon:yes stop_codon:yes gene_type:complete